MLHTLHPSLNQFYNRIARRPDSHLPLLLSGEAGTGKEVLARVIHSAGNFRHTPFTVIPCPLMTEEKLEMALCTAATPLARGSADNDTTEVAVTLFLKHVEASSPALQKRLLRLLQEKSVTHPLTHQTKHLVLRVFASSRKILEQEVAAGHFRQDLFYRLTITAYVLPPLRERKEDLLHFVQHFAACYAAHCQEPVATFSAPALAALQEYDWPGNIRECRRVVWQSLQQNTSRARVIDRIRWVTEENAVNTPQAAGESGADNDRDFADDNLSPPGVPAARPAGRIQAHHAQFR
ncbi:MAG: sigma 54-interacting transcriptional regulator [candidate division KSB1 bacterium]|nr:sigma 54-interacting transcriptional regulator [candidate division KSB1 bacterium]MDZ7273640.1 sigma 54-interacting transcriptional regulator [candidate division KSB1 bacterium]MDZ7286769.1 sigma 54-interacting transcriptional regulator [candidate division KSB1 bacterium]MDZ7299874.1 sigma 54-interacting transcriptional regulator [candidate division KSB1 bacterium]MDZ7305811.1 sigma 54-interacting transcriptional regulator [candidate division KSB1 bacterium]